MSLDVGVVILCHGTDVSANVDRVVSSVLNEGVDAGAVTVVRNPSAHDEPLDVGHSGVTLLIPERNLGYAGGMNMGITHLQPQNRSFVLLATMDVHLDAGALRCMVGAAQKAKDFGVLGPELRWPGDGHVSWGVRWTARGRIDHVLLKPVDADGDGVVESDSIDGSVVLVKREVIEKIGLLVDRLFMYYEETEFCLRAKRAGWRVGVVLGAVAEQSPGEARRPGAFNYLMARNGLEFARMLAGRRGTVAALTRYVRQSYLLTRMRFSPKSDAARQRRATDSLKGLWQGVLAYFFDRWGPPPEDLSGLGDMTFPG